MFSQHRLKSHEFQPWIFSVIRQSVMATMPVSSFGDVCHLFIRYHSRYRYGLRYPYRLPLCLTGLWLAPASAYGARDAMNNCSFLFRLGGSAAVWLLHPIFSHGKTTAVKLLAETVNMER